MNAGQRDLGQNLARRENEATSASLGLSDWNELGMKMLPKCVGDEKDACGNTFSIGISRQFSGLGPRFGSTSPSALGGQRRRPAPFRNTNKYK